MHPRPFIQIWLFCALLVGGAHAATLPLLAKAIAQWTEGAGDVAFTQRARVFNDDGSIKEERLERYDPSLPDSQRWHLLKFNGQEPNDEQRKKWEVRKNSKARKKFNKSPLDYLDVDHATVSKESPTTVRFEVPVKPETFRLLDLEKLAILITVEKEHGTISHISATLREPMRVLLGVANVTNFDLDVGIEPPSESFDPKKQAGEVKADSSARVMMSKFGDPTEYRWSEFKRVPSYTGPKKVSEAEDERPARP